MRIGFLVVKSLTRGGGIETYTYEVGRRLAALGHDVIVFTMGHYGHASKVVQGMTVVPVPCIPGVATERLTASMSAVALATRYQPRLDILHLHTPMTGAFGVIPELKGRVTVVQMHGVDWQRSRWGNVARNLIKGMEHIVMRCLPTCTAVSQTQVNFYDKLYGRRLQMIPTGAQPAHISPRCDEIRKLGLLPDHYILFMSRLVPEKCPHLLVSAFRKLHTQYKLVIAGRAVPSDDYTRTLAGLADGDDRIIFPGFVSGDLKDQLFSNAALYVQPSELEGLSIALLEAMSYGVPCLTSDIPENIEAAGEGGFTFRSGSVDDLFVRLAEMLCMTADSKRAVAAAAQKRVLETFSWDTITGMLLSLYRRSLVENHARGNDLRFLGQLKRMIALPSTMKGTSKQLPVIVLNDNPNQEPRDPAMDPHILVELEKRGIATELIEVAGLGIRPCSQCGRCQKTMNCRCAETSDIANAIIAKMAAADGFVVEAGATPVLSGDLAALLERASFVARANGGLFRRKIGAVTSRGKHVPCGNIPTPLLTFLESNEVTVVGVSMSSSQKVDVVVADRSQKTFVSKVTRPATEMVLILNASKA